MKTPTNPLAESIAPLWHRELAVAVDRLSTELPGITSLALMEAAGEAVADIVTWRFDRKIPILVLVGRGNNGGDGLVIARRLKESGRIVHMVRPNVSGWKMSPDAERNCAGAESAGLTLTVHQGKGSLSRQFSGPVVIIDAVFGIGYQESQPDRAAAERALLLDAALVQERTVVAVDLPSALECDGTGPTPPPLFANLTVTFGSKKPAHVISPSRDACGEVLVADIFPPAAVARAIEQQEVRWAVAKDQVLLATDPWASLSPSAHKFDRGHVLIIGGSPGKVGATILAGLSALRTGAGWVSISVPDGALQSYAKMLPPELTFESLIDQNGKIATTDLCHFITSRKVKAVVLGPGSIAPQWSEETLHRLSQKSQQGLSVVVDAGALHGILDVMLPNASRPRWLLTPHPGEWQKLSTIRPAPLLQDPGRSFETVSRFTLVHKGATPIITAGEAHFPSIVLTQGSRVLAKAGSGDVLAGISAAHMALGLPADYAFARSYAMLCRAAEICAETLGKDSVLASDLIGMLGMRAARH